MQMNYSVFRGESRLRNFVDMVSEYLEICAREGLDSYDVALYMDKVWGRTMEKEWGWDVTEFLAQMITSYEQRS